ncbi:hypothetical protein NQ314_012945 [Rhamnusium bicolor]|uniref:Fatty acyl-CoA reductase C-terminal domain-containing protein n=1 Tax=Rhamnusium bicolor TaxID=1586634 RepID=A0AAV8X8A0_9CUCU|nr:hypothetical protein NQ314_012945 [Rhamnusium bicolor]
MALRLVKIQRKIFTANNALHYFLSNEWVFINTKAMALEKLLLPSDQLAFSYKTDSEQAVPFKFFTDGLMGCRRYLLNEPNSTMPQAKIHSRR